MKHFDQTHFETASAAPVLITEAYVRLLHPKNAIGKTTLMAKDTTGRAHCKTYDLNTAPVLAWNFLDGDGYISLHRFHGPRKGSQLAALNGLFLDLDIDRLPSGASRSVGGWSARRDDALPFTEAAAANRADVHGARPGCNLADQAPAAEGLAAMAGGAERPD